LNLSAFTNLPIGGGPFGETPGGGPPGNPCGGGPRIPGGGPIGGRNPGGGGPPLNGPCKFNGMKKTPLTLRFFYLPGPPNIGGGG
jgi:hypothetical protein